MQDNLVKGLFIATGVVSTTALGLVIRETVVRRKADKAILDKVENEFPKVIADNIINDIEKRFAQPQKQKPNSDKRRGNAAPDNGDEGDKK